jgi:hypothetical protein
VSPENCPAHRTSPGVIVEAGTREEEAGSGRGENGRLSGRNPAATAAIAKGGRDKCGWISVFALRSGSVQVGQARAEGVQIPIYGNEKLKYTVMVAITAALTKLPIRVIVKRKTARRMHLCGIPTTRSRDG